MVDPVVYTGMAPGGDGFRVTQLFQPSAEYITGLPYVSSVSLSDGLLLVDNVTGPNTGTAAWTVVQNLINALAPAIVNPDTYPAAVTVNPTDLLPISQGSTGPGTGTMRKATVAQFFTTPPPIGGVTPNTASFTDVTIGPQTAIRNFAHQSYITPTSGLLATPPFRLSANAFGTVSSGSAYFRAFNIDTDTMDTTAANGGGVNVNYFGHTISAGAVGGRTTFSVFMSQQGATTSAIGQYYVAGACFGEAAHSAGGSVGNPRGNLFATNHSARLKTGAGIYWNSLVGEEVDVSLQSGTAVLDKIGFKVVQWSDDVVSGSRADYAIGVNTQALGTAPGWNVGYAVGGPEGWWPIKSTGTIHGTYAAVIGGGPAMQAAYGIDYSAVTFSTAFLKSTGFQVNGSGDTVCRKLNVSTPTVPASAVATGTAGDIAWDFSYVYVCIAANTWKRSAISSW